MEQKKLKWYQFKMVNRIFGIHIKYFLPIAAVVYIAAWFGLMPEGFVGYFAFLMALGGVLSWVGSVTPLVRSVGGSLLLPLFGATVLSNLGAVPAVGAEAASVLMGGGLQMLFVSAVIVGSILSMDRKLMLASVIRYIPVLIISQVFALGFAFLSALITGTSFYDAVFFIAAPCMTGGSSGAIATLPSLYSSILGTDVSAMGGPMLAVAMVGTYIATAMVVIMKVLAEKFPKAMGNGHGMLLQKESPALKEARENWVPYEDSSLDYSQLGGGLFLSVAVMVLGVVLSNFIPQIVYVAMAIIICIDPVLYYTEDRAGILKYPDDVIFEQSWHPGYVDYFVYRLGERGNRSRAQQFVVGRAQDVEALCSSRLRDWIRENKIELVNFRDALYGTREYQNHLKNIGSDLCMI